MKWLFKTSLIFLLFATLIFLKLFYSKFPLDIRAITIFIWLSIVFFFKPKFQISLILGLLFFLLSSLTSYLTHHGFALRMSTYGFWFLVIGVIGAIISQIGPKGLSDEN